MLTRYERFPRDLSLHRVLEEIPQHSSCVVWYIFLTWFPGKMSFTAEQITMTIWIFNWFFMSESDVAIYLPKYTLCEFSDT